MDNDSFYGALSFFCLPPEEKIAYLGPPMGRRWVDIGEHEFETESNLKLIATYLTVTFDWDHIQNNLTGRCLDAASALVSILDVAWNEPEPFWNAEIIFSCDVFEAPPPFWKGAALLAQIAMADEAFLDGRLPRHEIGTFASLVDRFTSPLE